jgi:hypothetical protein
MYGRTDGDPETDHELTFKPTERRVEKGADTLTLDGNPYADGHTEPVEKADTNGETPTLDTDELTAELRKAAEQNRPDALDPDALAKDHTDRHPEPLTADKLREELHDQNLSTKGAVLEVRDELRELREDGATVPGGREVSKDADADTDGDTTPDDANTSTDADPEEDGGTPTDPDLAPDDPAPESVEGLADDPELMDALGVQKDDTGRPERPALAEYKLKIARAKARGASA